MKQLEGLSPTTENLKIKKTSKRFGWTIEIYQSNGYIRHLQQLHLPILNLTEAWKIFIISSFISNSVQFFREKSLELINLEVFVLLLVFLLNNFFISFLDFTQIPRKHLIVFMSSDTVCVLFSLCYC